MNTLQIRRGDSSNLPSLSNGEPGFTIDSHKFYIGYSGTNYQFAMHNDYNTNHSILRANTVGNPEAIQIGTNELIGRNSTGNISSLPASTVLNILDGNFINDFSLNGVKINDLDDPSASQDAATKNYVDNFVLTNRRFHKFVLTKDVLDPTAVTPSDGDRHWIGGTGVGAWSGHNFEIAEWKSSISGWKFETVYDGDVAYVTNSSYNSFFYYDADTSSLEQLDTNLGSHAPSHEFGGADEVDHDKLKNYSSSRHIDHTTIDINVSVPLTGGGAINQDVPIGLDETKVNHDNLKNHVDSQHVDHSGLDITAGVGLTGGGDMTLSRIIDLAIDGMTFFGNPADNDMVALYDDSDSSHKKTNLSSIKSFVNANMIEDIPVDTHTDIGISSNWAYDHQNLTAAHGTNSAVVGINDTQTLTNKTIDCGTW